MYPVIENLLTKTKHALFLTVLAYKKNAAVGWQSKKLDGGRLSSGPGEYPIDRCNGNLCIQKFA